MTFHSAIYLKFHGLFPKNQRGKHLSSSVQHSFAAWVSVRAHLGHHNHFQRRCTVHVLSEVDEHSPSWALRDSCEVIYLVAVGTHFAVH